MAHHHFPEIFLKVQILRDLDLCTKSPSQIEKEDRINQTTSSEMNIAPGIKNHLRSIDLLR